MDTADALRAVMHRLTAEDFLVVSGDLVSDVPVGAVAAAHRRQEALLTALLCARASDSEPGSVDKTKQPSACDIIGLDSTEKYLLYVTTGTQVSVPLRHVGLYEFSPRTLSLLAGFQFSDDNMGNV